MDSVNFEYKNICPHCGRENSLFPFFMGKKRGYKCDDKLSGGCGKMTKGITKSEAIKRGIEIKVSL